MHVPLAHLAIIDEAKITRYLLNIHHADGQSKAAFFMSMGFRVAEPDVLRAALLRHVRDHPIAYQRINTYGTFYEVRVPMMTPAGRTPTVLTAWHVEEDGRPPRLVTAHPA